MPCCCCSALSEPSGSAMAAGGSALPSGRSCSIRTPARMVAAARPIGPFRSLGPARPRLSSMMTNRNSTMMAPAYTRTWSTAMNCASSSTKMPASENSVTTSHRALATALLREMHSTAANTAIPENTQKTTVTSVIRSLPLGVGGIPQRRDGVRLRAQPLQVVHEAVARVLGVFVVHADVDRLFGADFLAVAAEDAAELVDLVDQRVAVPVLVLPRDQLDAVGRADLRAQAAGHALGAALLVGEHAVRAAPALRDRPVGRAALLGILHRHLGPEQVPEREPHALERGPQVGRLGRGPLHDLHTDGHQARSRTTEPATMRPRSSTKKTNTPRIRLRPNSAPAKRASYAQPSCACRNHTAVAMSVR